MGISSVITCRRCRGKEARPVHSHTIKSLVCYIACCACMHSRNTRLCTAESHWSLSIMKCFTSFQFWPYIPLCLDLRRGHRQQGHLHGQAALYPRGEGVAHVPPGREWHHPARLGGRRQVRKGREGGREGGRFALFGWCLWIGLLEASLHFLCQLFYLSRVRKVKSRLAPPLAIYLVGISTHLSRLLPSLLQRRLLGRDRPRHLRPLLHRHHPVRAVHPV